MIKPVLTVILCSLVIMCPLDLWGEAGSAIIQIKNGLLTVSLRDTPLKEVLEEISRQAKIKIILDKEIDRSLTLEFRDLSLEEGLRKILDGTDYYMLFTPTQGAVPYTIKEIRVIPRSPRTGKGTAIPVAGKREPIKNPFIEALKAAKEEAQKTKAHKRRK